MATGGDAARPKTQFCGYANVADFTSAITSKADEIHDAAARLPTGDDYDYHTTFRQFPKQMAHYHDTSVDLLGKLVAHQHKDKETKELTKAATDPKTTEVLTDTIDNLMENIDTVLDELAGVRAGETDRKRGRQKEPEDRIGSVLRPQSKFVPPPDNSNTPFKIKIYAADGTITYGEPNRHYCRKAIQNFEPDPELLIVTEEQPFQPLDKVSCQWIDTAAELQELKNTLMQQTEIAVDLEHHSYRSFQGFLCLMQISTRTADYLIDVLELFNHMHILSDVFTNPKIVKVMHGANHDVDWLQRDFGIYIVNLFDTFFASTLLEYPRKSLAYLLHHHCGVTADKKFQVADWRIRPLPSDMAKYAREDTHYMLFLYDRLRVLLHRANPPGVHDDPVFRVFQLSKDVCLRRYEKELWTERTPLNFLERTRTWLPPQKVQTLRVILKWRDTIARDLDESVAYVLPQSMALAIAREQPTTVQLLLNCCHPTPKLLRRDAKHLADQIKQAKSQQPDADCYLRRDEGGKTASTDSGSGSGSENRRPGSPVPCDGFGSVTNFVEGQDSNHSPVLGTDSLYQAAGWVEQAGTTTSMPSAIPAPASSTPSATNSNYGGFSFSNLRSELSTRQEREKFNSTTPTGGDGKGDKQYADGPFQSPSPFFQSFMFGDKPSKNSTIDVGNLLEHICLEVSASAAGSDIRSDFFGSPKASHGQSPTTGGETPNATSPTTHDSNADGGGDGDEQVPQSLGEIYCLSKQNKKRNKDKKKLKEASIANPTPAFATNMAEDGAGAQTDESMDQFMEKIGWADKQRLESMKATINSETPTKGAPTSPTSPQSPNSAQSPSQSTHSQHSHPHAHAHAHGGTSGMHGHSMGSPQSPQHSHTHHHNHGHNHGGGPHSHGHAHHHSPHHHHHQQSPPHHHHQQPPHPHQQMMFPQPQPHQQHSNRNSGGFQKGHHKKNFNTHNSQSFVPYNYSQHPAPFAGNGGNRNKH
eukprot:TRINITY_DN64627_c0_g1_i1.p1 TRINITY_DN64627_c0_g1~~TRINITY_DN64627_c0_g1_i1.p1  ORF type:complete len:982 (-),score=68.44 TRINITY_DN64627_c0_g1_i1:142-3087(-)